MVISKQLNFQMSSPVQTFHDEDGGTWDFDLNLSESDGEFVVILCFSYTFSSATFRRLNHDRVADLSCDVQALHYVIDTCLLESAVRNSYDGTKSCLIGFMNKLFALFQHTYLSHIETLFLLLWVPI